MSQLDPTAHEAKEELGKLGSTITRLSLTVVALVILCAALAYSVLAEKQATQAKASSLAACQLYKAAAESPVSRDKTSVLGLKLVAGGRVAYVIARCGMGKLDAPDPLIVPYLPAGMKP